MPYKMALLCFSIWGLCQILVLMFTFLVDIFILKNDFHTGTFDKLIFDTLDVICLLNQ